MYEAPQKHIQKVSGFFKKTQKHILIFDNIEHVRIMNI